MTQTTAAFVVGLLQLLWRGIGCTRCLFLIKIRPDFLRRCKPGYTPQRGDGRFANIFNRTKMLQ